MRNNAREVSCYLSIEEAARFREAASANKVSLSRYLRQCLLDYERLIDNGSRAPNGFALIEMENGSRAALKCRAGASIRFTTSCMSCSRWSTGSRSFRWYICRRFLPNCAKAR